MENIIAGASKGALGAATYTFLFDRSFVDAIDGVAASGVKFVELTAAPPHVENCHVDAALARSVRRRLDERGLTAVSFNPTFLDLNLASLNSGMRAETVRQIESAARACHELEVPTLVLFPGRRHVLAPAPLDMSRRILMDELYKLLPLVAKLGVTIAIENGPTFFLDHAADVASVCKEIDSPHLRAVFDLANSHMVEDLSSALSAVAPYLVLVHLSDTTRARWAHGAVGSGDVAFAEFAATLDDEGYQGVSVMEIVDFSRPEAALAESAQALKAYGWSTA